MKDGNIPPSSLLSRDTANLNSIRLLRGSNTSSASNKNPENKRRDLILLAGLIEHPDVGLILFETGCAEDIDVVRLCLGL